MICFKKIKCKNCGHINKNIIRYNVRKYWEYECEKCKGWKELRGEPN